MQDASNGAVLFQQSPALTLPTASVGKILLLFHIAESVARGTVRLDERLTRTADDAVADSGIWQYLALDTMAVGDLCELVGIVSDNLATNVLLSRFGLDKVAATAARLGLTATALHDRVRDVREPGHPATLSSGSAAELTTLMLRLHAEPAGGAGSRVLGWLAKGADLSQVASGWGLDPLAHLDADRGLRVANKTGTDLGVRAEVGLLTGPARTIGYAVIANWDEGAEPEQRPAVLDRQRQIGLRIACAARGGAMSRSRARRLVK